MESKKENKVISFARLMILCFLSMTAAAQQLKPTEIVYSRLPNNINAPPTGSNQPSIWAVGQDGSNDRFITYGTQPRISDDGRFLLFKRFTRSPSGFNPFGGYADFFIRELATGAETLIVSTNFDQGSVGHYFSPESNQGFFEIVADDSCNMYKFNRNGSGITPLYPASQPAYCADDLPVLRRGGDQLIAFHNLSTDLVNGGGLFTVGIGGALRQKIPNTICGDIDPAWANDSQFIGFGTFYLPCGSNFPQASYPYFIRNLWKIKVDGTSRQQLTNFTPGDCSQMGVSCLTFGMVWTENNARLIVAGRINGVAGLFAFNTDGSAAFSQIPITTGNPPDFVGGIVQSRVEQNVVSSGGGVTTGGNYTLVSTIGEPVAGIISSGGTYSFESGFWALPGSSLRPPFDFDGDSKTDIGITRQNGGNLEWWLNRSYTNAVFATVFGISSDIPIPADYTGDGKTDVAVFRRSNGNWIILRSEDFSFLAFPFGANGDTPMPADFDADGKADATVFRPSQGLWFINQTGGGGVLISQFGTAGDQPVSSDYDGDGKADIGIVRNNGGNKEWWIQRSALGLFATVFGISTDRTVPGDYTGDGKSDIAVFRPSNGNWLILRSEDFSFLAFPWGTTGDIPSPGDYDGDGKFDSAVFRPSAATWFINRTGGQGPLISAFGAPTDTPVPSVFVR